jgi:prepilin-type N-terminal cleavage/methylation domain-containing protein
MWFCNEAEDSNKQERGDSMNKQQGFSLIELLIVVAIIAIIAAIAVPSMLTSRMAANEAGAIQGCRTIGSAEVAYAAVNNQSYATITDLIGGNFLDSRFAEDGNGFNGYGYAEGDVDEAPDAALAAIPAGFGFNAAPKTQDSSGRYSYGIAADQVVRYIGTTLPNGVTAGDPIGKNAAAGS